MLTKFKILAVAAAFGGGNVERSDGAICLRAGLHLDYNGVCQPASPQGYGNPVSGAVSGEADRRRWGAATGGPVGAVVGGALGTATGALQGTGNMLSGGSTPPSGTGLRRRLHLLQRSLLPGPLRLVVGRVQ